MASGFKACPFCRSRAERIVEQDARVAELEAFVEAVRGLQGRVVARGENAYCDMLSTARSDDALGWKVKVDRGEFGQKELDAHARCGELLGRHRAMMEVARDLAALAGGGKEG